MEATTPSYLSVLVLIALLLPSFAGSQTSANTFEDKKNLPQVFQLGNFDKSYEDIMPGYQTLLEACDGEMDSAFNKLYSMMKEMESYAALTGYDLKGINAWMHFFWKEDGTIEHIGFHLKPNSRNVDTEKLKAFLAEFAQQYTFPHTASAQYAHYSTFSFPVF